MKRLLGAAAMSVVGLLSACAAPNAAISTASFHFADYDYVVVAKPAATDSALYGMDVGLANLMESHGYTAIGDRAFGMLTPPEQRRTLNARLALISNADEKNLLAVSFDDAVSGETGASISEVAKGDMFDNGDRKDAFAKLAKTIEFALKPETAALNAKLAAKKQAALSSLQPADRIADPGPPAPIAVTEP